MPVYWTLAVEAQYYVLIGLLFPLLIHRLEGVRVITIGIWILLPLIISIKGSVFGYLALFGVGIVLFLGKEQLISRAAFILLMTAACLVHYIVSDFSNAIIGLLTALAIIYSPEIKSRALEIGTISYSVYLIHMIVGGRVINLFERLPDTFFYRVSGLLIALLVTLGCSAIFYLLIEGPSHRFSKKLGVGR